MKQEDLDKKVDNFKKKLQEKLEAQGMQVLSIEEAMQMIARRAFFIGMFTGLLLSFAGFMIIKAI